MTEWTVAAQGALSRLDGEQWADKKKATIIALVDAHLAGRSEETVWSKPETCSRTVYHQRWKRNPLFAEVLAEVDGLAKGWRDGRSLRALNDAADMLALAAPVAVGKLLKRLKSTDESIVVRAAIAILDRAGMETATKSSSSVDVDVSKLSDEELQRIVAG